MKRTSLQRSVVGVLTLAVALFVMGGCSEDPGTGSNTGEENLDPVIDDVILDPKSAGLGDTLAVTAVVDVDSDGDGFLDFKDRCPSAPEDFNGIEDEDGCPDASSVGGGSQSSAADGFLTYAWTASGGTLLETKLSTVRWVAPTSSAVFTLTVTVSNGAVTRTASREVFVSSIVPLVANNAGQMHLSGTGDTLAYFSTPVVPGESGFRGFGVGMVRSGVVTQPMSPNFTFQTRLNRSLNKVAYVTVGGFGSIQVLYRDLNTGAVTIIPAAPLIGRLPQYTEPEFSPDDLLMTYQVWLPDWTATPAQGGVDTFIVATWDPLTLTEQRTAVGGAGTGAHGLNFHPTFSNDGRHLVYMADPAGTFDWELYALPVSGRSVPVDTSMTPTRLTFSGGIMGFGRPPGIRPRKWNPNTSIPVLATLDADNNLRLVPTDGSGEILVSVPGDVSDFVWVASGQGLMITTGSVIYRVTNAGAATAVRTAASGDILSRVSVSSDEQLLLYAVTRFTDVWYEIVDLTGVTGITAPLRVTPAGAPGNAAVYVGFGSNSPLWAPAEPKAYVLFFAPGPTPRISTIDFGGLYP